MKKIFTILFCSSFCFFMKVNAQTNNDLKLIFEKCMIQAELQAEYQQTPSGLLKVNVVKNNFFSSNLFKKWEGYTINYINSSETSSVKNYIEFLSLDHNDKEATIVFRDMDNTNRDSFHHEYRMTQENGQWSIKKNNTKRITKN